ncbi:MAG: hypothetical protein ABW318_07595 [Vicinamibacterales bacterium]
MTTRPAADEIPALLEPIVRERIPGADTARIVNWRGTERGFSTETFLFELDTDDSSGAPNTLTRLVFRRPPQVSLFPDYDLLRQVLVMRRLQATPVTVPAVRWLDRGDDALGTPYFVMEQVPTWAVRANFLRTTRRACTSMPHRKNERPCGGAACRPSPMSTRWTGAS